MERAEVFPAVTVLILNWNGWWDTIECLETVAKQEFTDFKVLIIDNGSDDDSVQKILAWARGEITDISTRFSDLVYPLIPKPVSIQVLPDPESEPNKAVDYYLLKLDHNLGFARGMNVGLRFVTSFLKSEYVLLLNNDTVLDSKALGNLISVFKKEPQVAMAQSTIWYYDWPERIANAGGRILPWGQTRYYKKIKSSENKKIEFINGCALCVRRSVLEQYGYLTEKFFFGEEDFEWSLRARQNKLTMVAVGNSKVYHKIAASSERNWQKDGRKVIIFALNRLIDLKDFWPRWQWQILRFFSVFYFAFLLLTRYRIGMLRTLKFGWTIFKYAGSLKQFQKEDIEFVLSNEI
ncbi:glycosyltransferase family 2 protein [Calditrichota bacterium LG25]